MSDLDDAVSELTAQLSRPGLSEDDFNEIVRRRRVLLAERDAEAG